MDIVRSNGHSIQQNRWWQRARSRTTRVGAIAAGVLLAAMFTPPASAQPVDEIPDFTLDWGESAGPGEVAPMGVNVGGCAGYFSDIQKVNNFIEWGFESHCTGTGWMPHNVTVTLQQSRLGLSFDTVTTRTSASHNMGSPDISVYWHDLECEYGTSHTFRMKATITAGSHSKSGLSDEYRLPCQL